MRMSDERGDLQSLQITIVLIVVIGGLFAATYGIFGIERVHSWGKGMPAWQVALCTLGAMVLLFGSLFAWVGLKRAREDREYYRRKQEK